MAITPLPFGPWISNSGTLLPATSGTVSGYVYALNSPVTNVTVQANVTGVFSGTVNVQLIGSLDGINFFPLASGLFSGGSSNIFSTVALNGPTAWLGTQVTSYSGVGNTNTITTFVWAK
jgi:hypothetical protein